MHRILLKAFRLYVCGCELIPTPTPSRTHTHTDIPTYLSKNGSGGMWYRCWPLHIYVYGLCVFSICNTNMLTSQGLTAACGDDSGIRLMCVQSNRAQLNVDSAESVLGVKTHDPIIISWPHSTPLLIYGSNVRCQSSECVVVAELRRINLISDRKRVEAANG